jgi:5-(carboxyamino)imidazole ribonucleotide mutase
MPVVIIAGSPSDKDHVKKLTDALETNKIMWQSHYASAHKQPQEVLKIIKSYENRNDIVYITVAGRSNALSGFVAANSNFPTLACPPFADKTDMLVNIHSTLQMPSQVPVMTVLDAANCVLAAMRILNLK